MRTHVIYNKNGRLSAYGLACGYVEKKQGKSNWKEIYKEGGVYHVRQGVNGQKFSVWESFETVSGARKMYNSIKL